MRTSAQARGEIGGSIATLLPEVWVGEPPIIYGAEVDPGVAASEPVDELPGAGDHVLSVSGELVVVEQLTDGAFAVLGLLGDDLEVGHHVVDPGERLLKRRLKESS